MHTVAKAQPLIMMCAQISIVVLFTAFQFKLVVAKLCVLFYLKLGAV